MTSVSNISRAVTTVAKPASAEELTSDIAKLRIREGALATQLKALEMKAPSQEIYEQISATRDELRDVRQQRSRKEHLLDEIKSDAERRKTRDQDGGAAAAAEQERDGKNPYARLIRGDLSRLNDAARRIAEDPLKVMHEPGDRTTMDEATVATAVLVAENDLPLHLDAASEGSLDADAASATAAPGTLATPHGGPGDRDGEDRVGDGERRRTALDRLEDIIAG